MSKVGRAATVGSKQRTETLTASKTIGKDETGELYFIDWNTGSALTVTLPPLRDGAYFKFTWITLMAHNSATVVFNSATNTAGDFGGTIVEQVPHAADGVTSVETAGSHDILTIGSTNDTSIGSWLECVCDGSTWHWSGTIFGAAAGNVVFSS